MENFLTYPHLLAANLILEEFSNIESAYQLMNSYQEMQPDGSSTDLAEAKKEKSQQAYINHATRVVFNMTWIERESFLDAIIAAVNTNEFPEYEPLYYPFKAAKNIK